MGVVPQVRAPHRARTRALWGASLEGGGVHACLHGEEGLLGACASLLRRQPTRPLAAAPPAAPSRYHHLHTDTPLDPHSPYEGFWWSHMGWLLDNQVRGSARQGRGA